MGSENWNRQKLGDIVELKYGKSLKGYKENTSGIPVFGTNGPIGFTKEPLTKGPGIIIGRKGAYRGVHYTPVDFYVIDTAYYLLPKINELDLKWIYYALLSKDLNSLDSGSAIPSTRKEDFYALNIPVPPLSIQKNIAIFLSNIDEKIDINNKIISNLQQISQALFKKWFIDFDFPNENGQPYKTSGGKLVDSELGMIPIDWKVEFLHGFVDFLSGGTPKTTVQEYWNGSIPFFTPKDAKANLYTTITEKTITELGLEKCNSKLYPKNTLFITARGTVGKLALANKAMAMNQSCFALKHKKNQQFYLYHVVENLVKKIILGANGAVFSAINLSDLKHLKYTYSNENLISKFENTVSFFYDQMSLLEEENIKLQQIRDSLLPKLLSGEIKISDELEV